MPKVSQEYRDARRGQILDAARRCFLRDGFHETSMQDLFSEAGLSAGAVYRYFASKDEMILAIAEENIRDVVALIHSLATDAQGEGLGATIARVLEIVRERTAQSGLGGIAVLVWSEALRTPAVATRFNAILDEMRSDFLEVVRAGQADGSLPPAPPAGPPAEALAAMLMAIVPGYILQLVLFGEGAVAGVPDAARAMWP